MDAMMVLSMDSVMAKNLVLMMEKSWVIMMANKMDRVTVLRMVLLMGLLMVSTKDSMMYSRLDRWMTLWRYMYTRVGLIEGEIFPLYLAVPKNAYCFAACAQIDTTTNRQSQPYECSSKVAFSIVGIKFH